MHYKYHKTINFNKINKNNNLNKILIIIIQIINYNNK